MNEETGRILKIRFMDSTEESFEFSPVENQVKIQIQFQQPHKRVAECETSHSRNGRPCPDNPLPERQVHRSHARAGNAA